MSRKCFRVNSQRKCSRLPLLLRDASWGFPIYIRYLAEYDESLLLLSPEAVSFVAYSDKSPGDKGQ